MVKKLMIAHLVFKITIISQENVFHRVVNNIFKIRLAEHVIHALLDVFIVI